jgi:tetratricopeptide (TPR) repeat protein
MDDAVGDLVAALRVHGLLDETWVVVAGDHGESLGRHGEETHSILCYDTTLDVPLFVRFPDGLRAGERSDALVSVADVYPTLIDALDLGGAEDVDGISLLGDPDPDRGVYFESYAGFLNHGWSPLVGWANAAGKYLHSSAPELYDESDANEQHNLWPAESQRAERYTRALDALARRPKLAVSEADRLREDVSDSVRALGYAGAGDPDAEIPPPLADTGLPAPASRMGELKAYYDATLLSLAGRDDDAIAAMRAVVAENQRNFAALEMLAGFLRETGREAEAVEVLDQLIALGSNRLRTHDTLGHALEALGELERAADHFRLALERLPSDPHQAADVARLEGRLSGDR